MNMIIKKKISITGIFLFFFLNAGATGFYCDPVNGSMANEGTKASPWSTLQAVFEAHKSFTAGDTIYLKKGDHGRPYLYGRNNDYVVITNYANDTAILESIRFSSASYWEVEGLHISSELPDGKDVYDFYYLVQTSSTCDHLIFRNCEIYSARDTRDWTRDDWFTRPASGFMLESTETQLLNNRIRNINFGIEVKGQQTVVDSNLIENFVGDAIRGLASFCRYEYNVVKNCYDVTGYNPSQEGPGNHDDGFQSYTSAVGGVEETVEEVVLRNNIFISYTDPDQIEKSMMQGIACFDGYYYNWTVENNLVVTDCWHGISFLGVEDSKIANNTILTNPIYNDLKVNDTPAEDMTPWIWIGPLKSDRGSGPSNDNIIRNNLVIQSNASFSGYKNIYDQGENTLLQNNHTVPTGQESSFFLDPDNFDYRLKSGSQAIDFGINIDLPMTDLARTPRLAGPAVDAGAYEFDDGTATSNAPVLFPIPDTTMMEGDVLTLLITASDSDQDNLTYSITPQVLFITFTDNGNGEASLTARPQGGQYGIYHLTVTVTDGMYDNIRNFTLDVAQNPNLSIQTTATGQLKLYPNPVKEGYFFVLTDKESSFVAEKIRITEISGKTVYTARLRKNWGKTVRVDLPATLGSGTYLVIITTAAGERITRTIVVNR